MRAHPVATIVRWAPYATVVAMAAMPFARTALADTLPSVDVRTWAPSADPRASLVLEPASSPGPWVFSTGAWMHYENNSVVLRLPATGSVYARPLENQLGLDLAASFGLGKRTEVGVRLPMFLYEQGSGGLPPAILSASHVANTGLGDVALLGKETLLANDDGGLGLAALGTVTLPTGAKTSFSSEDAPTVSLRVLADLSMRVASLQASLGYTLRTAHREWPDATVGGVTFGDAIPWTVGLVVRPAVVHALDPAGRQTWEVALHGALPAGPVAPFGLSGSGSAALSPMLLALSDRVGLGRQDLYALAGIDVGLDRAVGVPSVRVIVAVGWSFKNHDQDGDGVDDDLDQCPTLAEDRDGFEDADGCPEVDNDDDGIIDREDACPNVAGAPSSDPRNNGCPR